MSDAILTMNLAVADYERRVEDTALSYLQEYNLGRLTRRELMERMPPP